MPGVVLCVHVVCMYIHVVDKCTVAVSVMCMFAVLNTCNVMYYNIMFAAYVHVHCVGFAQFYYFYNHKEPVCIILL